MSCFVYINQSLKSGRYYIGCSVDPIRRLSEHNTGKVKATSKMIPWINKYCQKYDSAREARRIEYQLKKMKRRDIIERIIKEKVITLT